MALIYDFYGCCASFGSKSCSQAVHFFLQLAGWNGESVVDFGLQWCW
jgi:hypothetical protein